MPAAAVWAGFFCGFDAKVTGEFVLGWKIAPVRWGRTSAQSVWSTEIARPAREAAKRGSPAPPSPPRPPPGR